MGCASMKTAVLNAFVNQGSSWHRMDAIAEVSTVNYGFPKLVSHIPLGPSRIILLPSGQEILGRVLIRYEFLIS